MVTKLTRNQWKEILLRQELTKEIDLSIFQALYSFEEHKAFASQIGLLLGYGGKSPHAPVNLEVGRYAKRIAKFYDINFPKRDTGKFKYWNFFFNGWVDGNFFVWQLKTEIAEALEECNLTDEKFYPEELIYEGSNLLFEGAKKNVIVNTYERNPKARNICISHWGSQCVVCNFNFLKVYGAIGYNFIHVHHLVLLSEIGCSYQLDPIKDLRPVCPNCHAMLHTSNPPLNIEELQRIIHANKKE